MARLLRHWIESPRACSYLPEQRASLETRVMVDVTPEELEALLVRGWRRFGPCYFRPACARCTECVSIRIPVERFRPSQSQKRAWKSCADLRVVVGPPRVDQERLALYQRWHAFREDARGWEPSFMDARTYEIEFAFPHPSGREVAFYDDNPKEGDAPRLVGVGICDQTPNAWSAVYFYYDPEYKKRSLGSANVLFQIEHAKRLGIPYVYLGYWVKDCPSMRYKSGFRPHELLRSYPALHEEPHWIPGEE